MRNRFTFLALASMALMLAMSRPVSISGFGLLPRCRLPRQSPTPRAPDLSGDWTADQRRGGFGQSMSISDMGGRKRGQEDDIPYLPWAREKTLAEKPSTGPTPYFGETTDPQVLYCEPPGVPHIYLWPIKTKFVQSTEAVYILYELGPYYRVVWLNTKHHEDPDPQWWGHSIGSYENGNTLVVDTVGFNDKTWLDQMGHPHTEQLHLIERYKRVDADTLELDASSSTIRGRQKPWNAGTSRLRRRDSYATSRSVRCGKTRHSRQAVAAKPPPAPSK
jgi:hypothetical protein